MPTERLQVYKCATCGIVTGVLHGGPANLVCCGKPMNLLKENTVDAAKEKHVPVVTATPEGMTVTVGSVPHPMTAEHLIEWIEVIAGNRVCRVELAPGQKPEASFPIKPGPGVVVREYCNLHGVWKA